MHDKGLKGTSGHEKGHVCMMDLKAPLTMARDMMENVKDFQSSHATRRAYMI